MWTCTECRLSVMFSAADPELDERGFFFICKGCGHRNPLRRVGPTERGEDDPLCLAQVVDA
ncbi:hypothetical protein E6A55_33840 (plasmid) [Cupriavidus necator H16]|uniref:Uncharacterized protein n=1 Tax=Cupriavidus necator (strain ATCC 17699 / DSM 428 / KCTC 22496 / NCIMB 10442 / H16 / Stanier 337) TaxID=381666 RepID=A0AAF1D5L1_CUPNH|nr:hypothetical protein E6A55_33840 [Cupriavidus necator H16]